MNGYLRSCTRADTCFHHDGVRRQFLEIFENPVLSLRFGIGKSSFVTKEVTTLKTLP